MEGAVTTGADLLVEHLLAHGVRTVFGMPGSHVTAVYDAIFRNNEKMKKKEEEEEEEKKKSDNEEEKRKYKGHLISTVLIRNEQSGACCADGFARVTMRFRNDGVDGDGDSVGVILTTAGPGATNALTGLAEAFADSSPVLLLAGQVQPKRSPRVFVVVLFSVLIARWMKTNNR